MGFASAVEDVKIEMRHPLQHTPVNRVGGKAIHRRWMVFVKTL
jgi:hypothetical protein